MICVQDVPICSTAYLAFRLLIDGAIVPLAIDLGATPKDTAKAVRAYGGAIFDDSFHVWRCVQMPTKSGIADSIRRKQPRRTLLSVQSAEVFKDDLDVNDYWVVDWASTVEILNELEAVR